MPHLFTCPHCQTKTLVDDQFSGHVGRCVTCDQPIEIPNFHVDSETQSQSTHRIGSSLSPMARRLIAATLGVIALAGLAGVLYRYGAPAIATLATGRDRAIAIKNLEQIASALNSYAADHNGVYPLPIVRDSAGKPMHSWRVAILPYLNEPQLYTSYNFDKPWDDPENMLIVESMPNVYATPQQGPWSGYDCKYQLVSGDRTLFPRSGPLGPKSLIDDPTKTALVVEGLPRSNPPSVWTEPNEMEFAIMTGAIGGSPEAEIGGVTEGGVVIATVDGAGHFLTETTAPEIVRAILTANGGEPLADDVLD